MVNDRLEYLREQIRAERISMGELLELHDMAELIDDDDTELLEWAGVPEFPSHDPALIEGRGRWLVMDDEMISDYREGEMIPLAMRREDGALQVWMPPHDFPRGSGGCWHCGLVPLDYDAIETDCDVT